MNYFLVYLFGILPSLLVFYWFFHYTETGGVREKNTAFYVAVFCSVLWPFYGTCAIVFSVVVNAAGPATKLFDKILS